MKILPIKGVRSYHALRAYSHALLGLNMLPEHMAKDHDTFYEEIKAQGPEAVERAIRQAVKFVALEDDEVGHVLSFVADANGVPLGPSNIKNLGPHEITEAVTAVFLEISRMPVDLVTDEEKKKSS